MGELKKLNDLDLLNCDKVLKLKRRYLVRRIQVSHNKAVLIWETLLIIVLRMVHPYKLIYYKSVLYVHWA